MVVKRWIPECKLSYMYYIVFGILYGVSRLPLRRQTVNKNLALAFPEKTAAERNKIAKAFYRNFWDNWIEALKLLSITRQSLQYRVSANLDVLENIYRSGRSCHILLGHQFNWEWGNAFVSAGTAKPLLAAYSPLSNKIFDRLFLYMRRRFGTVLLPFNDMKKGMLPFRGRQYGLALMADQSPPLPAKSYWINFFNTPTAFLKGPERGAKLGGIPVIFISLNRLRRGHYYLEAQLLTANAGKLQAGELTQQYAAALEASIRRSPSLYLWSHNRWKHQWQDVYDKLPAK